MQAQERLVQQQGLAAVGLGRGVQGREPGGLERSAADQGQRVAVADGVAELLGEALAQGQPALVAAFQEGQAQFGPAAHAGVRQRRAVAGAGDGSLVQAGQHAPGEGHAGGRFQGPFGADPVALAGGGGQALGLEAHEALLDQPRVRRPGLGLGEAPGAFHHPGQVAVAGGQAEPGQALQQRPVRPPEGGPGPRGCRMPSRAVSTFQDRRIGGGWIPSGSTGA